MGCSPGKHQPQDIEGDSMTLSPLSAQHINTETGERISEFYFHQQPWDKSFTRTDATVTKTYTRSEFLDERTPQYRPDIDGLRAVAVLAVVVYHLNSSWLPTGLVGVDIFFTISGFVVTSSLWGHLEDDEGVCAFCTDFFARRAKRLLPTALIVISSTALALALVAPQWDPRAERFLLVGLSGTFANANNWLVYERDDYMDFFSNDVHDYNPFLHLWSLGVEEQFYLVVPWLLYVCLHSLDRGTGPRTAIFWILSVISIALGWWVEVIGLPYYAFYLLPARFWELAAGVILFLFCAKKDTVISDMLRRQPTLLLLLQSWTALLFLVAFLVKFEEKSFPLPGALMPVIGTVCFILCGFAPFSLLNKLLSVGPMVFIGRISYCIYLWHVPVLSLCRWLTLGSEMPMALRLFTLLPTSLLAIATHFFVEAPLRKLQMSSRWALITSFIASIGAALFLVLLLVIRHSLGDSYFLWLACVALMSLLVIFVLFSCQTEERPGSRNLFMFICILVCAAFGLTYNIYHDNAGLHSAQQVMVNPRAEAERSVAPAAVQSSCTVCSCAIETLTYHLPPESCTPHAWSCDRPQVPCFQGTPLAESDFQPHVPWGHENCLGAAMSEDEILARCLVPEQKRTIWLIGDSHSFALVPCISMTADALGIPVHNYSWPAHHACDMDWSKIFNVLEVRVNPGDIVAFSTCFYCMEWCLPHFEELIQRLVAFVGVKNAKLLIFKDVPLLNHNSVNCANSNPAAPTECSISAEQATVDVKEADDMLAAYSKDFGMIDLFSPMCMEGRCDIFVPGTSAVAYVDKTHINLNGCHYLAPFICSGMRSLGYI